MKVIKRDGRKVIFNKEKIKDAILKAFQEVDGEVTQYARDKARDITTYIEESVTDGVTVEEIQNIIETKLMASNRKDVAKSFILYRNNRTRIREKKTKIMMDVAEKLRADNVQNQNANVDEKSFGGRVGEASDAVMKQFALDNCMSEKARNNHLLNRIYTHDLASYAVGNHNCLTIPYDDLLKNGFNTRQTDVRPAKSVNTSFQLFAVIAQLQSLQQFGGVSASHIDWTMVPYVRLSFTKHLGDGLVYVERKSEYKVNRFHKWLEHDENHPDGTIHFDDEEFKKFHPDAWEYAMDMTIKEVYQAVEGLYHNLSNIRATQ
jgi:ribonucleoside-triphosphate reductase